MKKWLIIINNFVHDLCTGIWASSILTIYLLEKKADSSGLEAFSLAFHDVMRWFFWLGLASIAVIIITGVLRLIEYRNEDSASGSDKVKDTVLILKHILLGTIFIGGTYLGYIYTFY